MKLSVIIPCFNAGQTISQQLEALTKQEWSQPWEIIIADNGSTDNSREIIQAYQDKLPHLRLIDASAKRGAAYARNAGVKAAQADMLAFCDADDEVAPGWVAAMGTALREHDLVGGRDEHWKLNPEWLVKVYGCEEGNGIYFDHPFLPLLSGNNIAVKRSLHEAVGGFDENLTILEDVDYCWRIQQLGIKPYEAKDALVHFRLRDRIPQICQRAWKMGVDEGRLYRKHRSQGMTQPITWKTVIKTTGLFAIRLVTLKIRDKISLTQNLMDLAWRGGQLQGLIKSST